MECTALRRASCLTPVVFAALWLTSSSLQAQTIRGRLLDVQTGQPIDLGILVLLTADGDTVGMTASTPDGRFTFTAPDPGSFLLQAWAFGYSRRQEGVFELGEGGEMEIEFRISPLAIALEGMIVSVDRPRPNHPLIRNGFVRRYQLGLGHFITPRDLERTAHFNTASLFRFVPGMRVVTSSESTAGGGRVLGPATDRVLMRDPFGGGYCAPAVIIDGVRTRYSPGTGETLSLLVPIGWVDAVEIYRRPAEIPPEYAGAANLEGCGVIVFWTKR